MASTRRIVLRLLTAAALLGVLLVATGFGLIAWFWSGAKIDTAGQVQFDNALRIPPLAASRLDERGNRVFALTAQEGNMELRPGRPARTWGFNGPYLGPTLRATRGETVRVDVRNDLPETTTVHWHGMRLPARMDGGPHQPIRPGATWSPTWKVDQPAATLWYHPHPHGETERHVYRGLAGLFLLDEPHPPAGLPARYGVDDIPVLVQDVRVAADGGLDQGRPPMSPIGRMGGDVLVNGTLRPYLDVATQRVRLRLVNASTARVYRFGFDDDRPFSLVGTDGGLLARPHVDRRVQLSPGERAEIVVTLGPGERTVLRSYPPQLGTDAVSRRFAGGDDRLDVLELRAGRQLRPSPPVPAALATVPPPDAGTAVATRRFELDGTRINGRDMDLARVDAAVTRDTVEVWEVTNGGGSPHNFHVHDMQFRVLAVDGEPPPPPLAGWKDTVFLRPQQRLRLALRFGPHADPRTPYMFHCHLLLHEDNGMMGQFVVVEPGQRPAERLRLDQETVDPSGHGHHHHAAGRPAAGPGQTLP
jgi:blue copper oxidase